PAPGLSQATYLRRAFSEPATLPPVGEKPGARRPGGRLAAGAPGPGGVLPPDLFLPVCAGYAQARGPHNRADRGGGCRPPGGAILQTGRPDRERSPGNLPKGPRPG